MAESYIGWIEKVQEAARDTGPHRRAFRDLSQEAGGIRRARRTDAPFTVRKTKVLQPRRELRNGELAVVDGASDNAALFGRSIQAGEQYEIDFGDGVRAVYRPSSEKNLFAQRGEFELVLPDRPDAKNLNQALERMDSLGLRDRCGHAPGYRAALPPQTGIPE